MANVNQVSPDGGTTLYDIEDTPVRSSIARTEDGTSPSATINTGEEFYHLNVLYKATQDIATTDTITPNGNCVVSPSITSQIAQKADISSLGTSAYKNSTSVVTNSTDLVESSAVKDIVGWGNKNLFDEKYPNITTTLTYRAIYVGNGEFTMSSNDSGSSTFSYLFFLAGNVSSGASSSVNGVWNGQSRTVTSVDGYVTVAYRIGGSGDTPVNSNTQIEKGDTATAYEPYHASVEDTLRDAEVVEGKNLLPTNGYKATTGDNVTFTYNSDGSVTAIGSTGSTLAEFYVPIPSELSGDFYFSGCPTGGSNSTFDVYAWDNTAGGRLKKWDGTTGSASDFGNTSQECKLIAGHTSSIRIRIKVNQSNINATFKLMLRKPTEDDTYEPYYIPLKDVVPTKANNSVIGTVEDGATASQAYAVGSHAIRNGKFITWKNAKAQGETINDASDYVSGDVASIGTSSITNFTGNTYAPNTIIDIGTFTLEANKTYLIIIGYASSDPNEEIDIELSLSQNTSIDTSRNRYISKKVDMASSIQLMTVQGIGSSDAVFHVIARHNASTNIGIYAYNQVICLN